MAFLTRLCLLALALGFWPLLGEEFTARLTPQALQLYNSLQDEYKHKAEQLGTTMENANQAVFLAAQEEIAHLKATLPHAELNMPAKQPSPTPNANYPTNVTPPPPQRLPNQPLPYVQTPNTLRY